jgi:hypothetical protein
LVPQRLASHDSRNSISDPDTIGQARLEDEMQTARTRIVVALLVAGCSGPPSGSPGAAWLSRDPEQRTVQLERQLRGFDVAMLETGHRYAELYWAGRDANWGAAAYHAGKIRLAIENGLERRPQRAGSARPFLAGALAELEAAIAARDPALFAVRFEALTAACNACHAAERVAFFEVRPPRVRLSPVRFEPRAAED